MAVWCAASRCNTLNLCVLSQTHRVEHVVLKYTIVAVVMAGLLGYAGFGTFSKTLWRAVKYSFLWGIALFFYWAPWRALRRLGSK